MLTVRLLARSALSMDLILSHISENGPQKVNMNKSHRLLNILKGKCFLGMYFTAELHTVMHIGPHSLPFYCHSTQPRFELPPHSQDALPHALFTNSPSR